MNQIKNRYFKNLQNIAKFKRKAFRYRSVNVQNFLTLALCQISICKTGKNSLARNDRWTQKRTKIFENSSHQNIDNRSINLRNYAATYYQALE